MSVSQEEVERVLCGIVNKGEFEVLHHGKWERNFAYNWNVGAILGAIREGRIRLKPTPTVRPWEAHEAVGKVVRAKGASENSAHLILSVDKNGTALIGVSTFSLCDLLPQWECIAPDGSVGPCGVVEGST